MRPLSTERGVTLMEVAIMMVATSAIVGALMPAVAATLRRAETTEATTAMNTIRDQLLQALNDLNYNRFSINGQNTGTRVQRLVSDGDIPREVSATGSATWQAPVDDLTGLTDFLERHLVTNNPGGNPANAYPTAGGNPWRGTYLNAPINPDPWGNRYMVNSQFFGGGALTQDVVVYSAGPDEEIDTQYSANPLAAGDDDLIVLVEA